MQIGHLIIRINQLTYFKNSWLSKKKPCTTEYDKPKAWHLRFLGYLGDSERGDIQTQNEVTIRRTLKLLGRNILTFSDRSHAIN